MKKRYLSRGIALILSVMLTMNSIPGYALAASNEEETKGLAASEEISEESEEKEADASENDSSVESVEESAEEVQEDASDVSEDDEDDITAKVSGEDDPENAEEPEEADKQSSEEASEADDAEISENADDQSAEEEKVYVPETDSEEPEKNTPSVEDEDKSLTNKPVKKQAARGIASTGEFAVYADEENETDYLNLTLSPNDDLTLHVYVVTDDASGLTYQWYNGSTNRKITGATSADFAIVPETGKSSYSFYCRVADQNGNSGEAHYDVYLENNLTVYADAEEESNSVTWYLSYADDLTLHVYASADDESGLTYQWYNYNTGNKITGETSADYEITPVAGEDHYYYYVRVADQYGNSGEAYYEIYLDNHLTVYADEENESNSVTWYLSYADDLTLHVYASADDESGLTYQWYKQNDRTYNYDKITGETSADYVMVTEAGKDFYRYQVLVSDGHGHTEAAYYEVNLDNNLTVYADVENESNTAYLYLSYADDLTLHVYASANDETSLTYQWYKQNDRTNNYDKITGATSADYVMVPEVGKDFYRYQVLVSDGHGHTEAAYYEVTLENNLTVYADEENERNYVYVTLSYADNLTLHVYASADDETGLTYQWFKNSTDNPIDGATSADCVIVPDVGEDNYTYYALVEDGHGHYCYAEYYVTLENNLIVYADEENERDYVYEYFSCADDLTLHVYASADDETGLTYQWFKNDTNNPIDGATSADYVIVPEAGDDNCKYYVLVEDGHGHYCYALYYVTLENNFTVYADEENLRDYIDLILSPADDLTLHVYASADDDKDMTFQWYGYDGGTYVEINGATTEDYVMEPEEDRNEYTYYVDVHDRYGHSATAWFYVTLDNHFQAFADLENESQSLEMDVVNVDDVTLQTHVIADDKSKLRYEWHYANWPYHTVEGETGAELALGCLDGDQHYYVIVQDGYGNAEYLYYDVYLVNHLTVYADSNGTNLSEMTVTPLDEVSLHVYAYADDSSELTYQWYDGEAEIEGATEADYVPGHVYGDKHFVVLVKDQYGNEGRAYYELDLENHLTVYADEEEATLQKEMTVSSAEEITLRVYASADDTSGLQYQWFEDGAEIEGATETEYAAGHMHGNKHYSVKVRDQYSEKEETAHYLITVDNHLVVYADEDSESAEKEMTVSSVDEVSLQPYVSTDDASALLFQWYKDGHEIEGATAADYSIGHVYGAAEYSVYVKDQYSGEEETVSFAINVDNHLAAYADEDTQSDTITVDLTPIEETTLHVFVTSDEMSGITYKWYEDGDMIPGADTADYTVSHVDQDKQYSVCVADEYSCAECVVYFNIHCDYRDTHLAAYADAERTAASAVVNVPYGENAALHVYTSADGESVFTYKWYDKNDAVIDGADSAEYVVKPQTSSDLYKVRVMDRYGNEAWAEYSIHIDNHLAVYADEEQTSDSADLNAYIGDDVRLNVYISADDKSEIAIQWYENGVAIDGAESSSYIAGSVDESKKYSVQVSDQYGNSGEAFYHLTVTERPLVITAQPEDGEALVGETVSFQVLASGADPSYQWQYSKDGGTNWVNCTATGSNTSNFSFKMLKSMSGRLYRCQVTSGTQTKVSETATLKLAFRITQQPEDAEALVGETVSFQVTASGTDLSYQWQYSKNGGSTWLNCTSKGYNTNRFAFSMTKSMSGRLYRCVVTEGENQLISEAATIKLAFSITKQPADVEAAVGETVSFQVTASGTDLSYQWQYSKNGGTTWLNCTSKGYNTNSLTFGMSKSMSGRLYRCVVTEGENQLISEAATLKLAVSITKQPADVEAAVGETVSFQVAASGTDLSYQWQYSKNGGTTWSNCTSKGYNTNSFTFKMTKSMSGRLYRCIVTEGENQLISEAATLTLAFKITKQPEDETAAVGETVKLQVTVSGMDPSYQWQYSKDGGTTWLNCTATGYNTNRFTFGMSKSMSGRLYRCVVTDNGAELISDEVLISLK